ncbi:MAG TPA: hypothetical protein DGG94_08035 [Micromonosporaceae bacterium]|nr:hypothetical protein [Micromonosporaceae bacterium]HCU49735.1 hypothetical protein [Micromonosporaceae bacterium]
MERSLATWERLLDDLHKEFQLREEELGLLHDIDRHLLDHERPDEGLFAEIVVRTGKLLGSFRTRILLKRGRFLENSYSTVEADVGERVLAIDSITSRCLTENVTINLGNLNSELPAQHDDGDHRIRRSLVATPIRLGEEPIGVLSAESTELDAFMRAHENVMAAVAAQVAIALQRVQSFDVDALVAYVDALVFSDDDDSKTVIQAALDRIMTELRRQKLQFSGAQILFHKGAEELEIVYSTNPSDIGLTVTIAESICGRALREKRTIVVGDVSRDPHYRRMLGSAIQSEMAVPILVGGGTVSIGVLNVESEELDVFGGFNKIAVNSFADRVKTLLAFAKLRADVTESLELRSTNELLAAVGDQASNMVHRLNNTVGAMRYRLKELQAAQADGTLAVDDDLKESLDALLSLADRTLDMPRRVTQLLSTEESAADINQCVREAVGEVGIPERVTLNLLLADDLLTHAPANFDIVVQNLVQNALDAMPDNGTLTITTAIDSHPALATNYVRVTVADTGRGIPLDIRPRIFDLQFTTKAEARKGMGLGLWWVRNFVRRAGGEVAVKSTVGIGTEFIVRLPLS